MLPQVPAVWVHFGRRLFSLLQRVVLRISFLTPQYFTPLLYPEGGIRCGSVGLLIGFWYLSSVSFLIWRQSCPCNRFRRPLELWEVEAPIFSLDDRLKYDGKVVSLTHQPPFFSPGKLLVLISVRGWVDHRVIVRLEELAQLKNPMNSSGFDPATFRLVAQSLNQLRYRVPLPSSFTFPNSFLIC
jgi:hypothetical protein